MKAATILSLASLALGSVIEQRACAGNNCNRAVTGTRAGLLPLESRSADCSAFQRVVVTRTPSTVTVVAWETEAAVVAERAVEERQAAPAPTVPAYASSCRDDAAYASACECFGIPPWTTTTGPRRVYTTVTSLATDCQAYATSAAPACAADCWVSAAGAASCDTDDLACQCEAANNAVIADAFNVCLPGVCPPAAAYDVYYAAANACNCHAATATPAPTPL